MRYSQVFTRGIIYDYNGMFPNMSYDSYVIAAIPFNFYKFIQNVEKNDNNEYTLVLDYSGQKDKFLTKELFDNRTRPFLVLFSNPYCSNGEICLSGFSTYSGFIHFLKTVAEDETNEGDKAILEEIIEIADGGPIFSFNDYYNALYLNYDNIDFENYTITLKVNFQSTYEHLLLTNAFIERGLMKKNDNNFYNYPNFICNWQNKEDEDVQDQITYIEDNENTGNMIMWIICD